MRSPTSARMVLSRYRPFRQACCRHACRRDSFGVVSRLPLLQELLGSAVPSGQRAVQPLREFSFFQVFFFGGGKTVVIKFARGIRSASFLACEYCRSPFGSASPFSQCLIQPFANCNIKFSSSFWQAYSSQVCRRDSIVVVACRSLFICLHIFPIVL